MSKVKVTNVRGVNNKEQRADICYVGRNFAGWPDTPWGNYPNKAVPIAYRNYLLTLPPGELDDLLEKLWAACQQGSKPLGCWCLNWDGEGETPTCHAAVWAEMLNQRHLGNVVEAGNETAQ